MNDSRPRLEVRVAFIGFGEAAQAFTQGWRSEVDVEICAYDLKTDDMEARNGKLEDYRQSGVAFMETAPESVADADVIVSAVTADATLDAAESVLPALSGGQLYLDINSAAPSRKQRAAECIAGGGGRYVDVAVMAPVHPNLHRTPLLIGGPGAVAVEPLFNRLDMNFETISETVGDASIIKMVRSIMIKGIESLTVECVLAAVKAGIDERILESLERSFPGMNWKDRAAYMMERVAVHGERRAAEMREVAVTLDNLGIGGTMAVATAERQQWLADLNAGAEFPGGIPDDYHTLAKTILALHEGQKGKM